MPRLQVEIGDELAELIDARADAEDRPKDRIILRAIEAYLATSYGIVGAWPPPVEVKVTPPESLGS